MCHSVSYRPWVVGSICGGIRVAKSDTYVLLCMLGVLYVGRCDVGVKTAYRGR